MIQRIGSVIGGEARARYHEMMRRKGGLTSRVERV
jgi:hypothetical protein